jgi:hypothetical protein
MKVSHIRNGIELPPILYNGHYDSSYQTTIQLDPAIELLPVTDQSAIDCLTYL